MAGSVIVVRPVRDEDLRRVVGMLEGLSVQSSYQRFLGAARTSASRYASTLLVADAALVAVRGVDVLGVGSLHRESAHSAEVALAVRDHDQGHGVGTLLLEGLVRAGRSCGLEWLTAEVLSQNVRMLTVLHDLGLRIEHGVPALGVVHVVVDLRDSAEFDRRAALRAATAEAASMNRLLRPASILVLADHSHHRSARKAARALRSNGFTGEVLVSTTTRPVAPGTDLVLVATSVSHLLHAVSRCVDAGVGAVVVQEPPRLSPTLMESVLQRAREGGFRVLGPGARLVVNTDPDVRLCVGTARGACAPVGRTALVGAGAPLRRAMKIVQETGTGVSVALDVGGGLDVDVLTAIHAALRDPGTAAVVVAAPDGRPPPWRDVGVVAEMMSKPVMVVGDRTGSADETAVVRLGWRDVRAALATASLRGGPALPGVIVVGVAEVAEPLRCSLRRRGVREATLTQQAEMRLRHLRLGSLVADGPPVDAGPEDLEAVVSTVADCPDVGVVVVAAPRPCHVVERRRLLGTYVAVAPTSPLCPVIGFVPGGLPGADVPVFADPDTCARLLRFVNRGRSVVGSSSTLTPGIGRDWSWDRPQDLGPFSPRARTGTLEP